jgi:hypothetical protein
MTLEVELNDVLRAARLDEKQRRAVSRRLGWDGLPPTTLAAAGAGEGYTRERVRQLEQRVLAHMERTRPAVPLAAAALAAIHTHAPASRGELTRTLMEARLTERPFDPLGVLRACELAGLDVGVVERSGVILRSEQTVVADSASLVLRRLVSRDGAASVDAIARQLASSPQTMRDLLEFRTDVTWLDDAHDWLVLPVARTRVTTGIRKMLSIASTLTLEEVEGGLARQRSEVTLPRAVLRALLATVSWLRLEVSSDLVSPVRALDAQLLLSPLERLLVDIFRAAQGDVLPLERIAESAMAKGMKRTSVGVYLSRSPIFKVVSRGRYALRGPAAATPVLA